jgi:hypothetical protein
MGVQLLLLSLLLLLLLFCTGKAAAPHPTT